MSRSVKLTANGRKLKASIRLGGSKSITNRALLIKALCEGTIDIKNESDSDDSKAMKRLLSQQDGAYDAGHAGTTFRFLTAYYAFKEGSQYLTGSERMQQRPIGVLVDALNSIGANIAYANNVGYPPLHIHAPSEDIKDTVILKADVSSQYISALLMLAPTLPNGLKIVLEGTLVSKPYLMMTLTMMADFGIKHTWHNNAIHIAHQKYTAKSYFVEADWSSASYLYSWAAASEEAEIEVTGLMEDSMQGDAAIAVIAKQFGVNTEYLSDNKLYITKSKENKAEVFIEHDFILHPDIAQTVFAMCAACRVQGLFTGLQTLYIKETDRINAFKTELAKIGISLIKVPPRFKQKDAREYFMLNGDLNFVGIPAFDTYHDHRMAMSLAPLSLLNGVVINDAEVVSKSYPTYWEDVKSLGITIEAIE
jgi:3-phosphoshikimate 1-carboxyvinyltransferase